MTEPATGNTSNINIEKYQKNAEEQHARIQLVTVNDPNCEQTQPLDAATPTMHISNSALANMVKDAQAEEEKVGSTGNQKQQNNANDIDARVHIVNVNANTCEASQAPTASTPTLLISNLELAKMVKDAQAAMMMNTTTKIKAPLVPLNTSVFEIPS